VSDAALQELPAAREVRVRARPSELKRVRELASAAAHRFGLDRHDRYQFAFAASEAVANAIEHGEPCSDGTIGLSLLEEADALTVTVCDCGTFTAPIAMPEELPERGRGLALIAMLMDEVDLKPGADRTVVRLSKRRAPALRTSVQTA
jgi:anti-sigma regulatory factor (Ser/Thr protein kinase)